LALYVQCGRCGGILGKAQDSREAAKINKAHLQDCKVDFWSS